MVIKLRLKHVKGSADKINSSDKIIKEPNKYKGNIKGLFNNDNEIHIEIGMGKGNFITENAKQHPNINYIGIEKYDSVIVRALEKELNLDNLFLIRMDATEIEDVFEKEIDTVYLNFSDPWPKDRHEKRRLSSHTFLKKYDKIFKNNKHIVMKTDNRKLFEFSVKSFTDYGYKIEKLSLDLYKDDITDNIPTEYEMKFHSKGFPIYMVEVTKK